MILSFSKNIHIHKDTKVLTADTGYQGIKQPHVRVELPKKKSRKQTLSKDNKQFNQKLASERVLNKNVIGSSTLKLLLIDIEIDVEDSN